MTQLTVRSCLTFENFRDISKDDDDTLELMKTMFMYYCEDLFLIPSQMYMLNICFSNGKVPVHRMITIKHHYKSIWFYIHCYIRKRQIDKSLEVKYKIIDLTFKKDLNGK